MVFQVTKRGVDGGPEEPTMDESGSEDIDVAGVEAPVCRDADEPDDVDAGDPDPVLASAAATRRRAGSDGASCCCFCSCWPAAAT